ncbi:hypothetical protein V475_05775 [Sphingobium baderi LL03]|uniref:Uncharacterized protein n=1 Tax=Sphingobium baderi LL03 TaxID=1114964 RepID=T0GWV9_9SPHN|nr:hypothetical protein L485_04110 [Sphingobium baderi LL03]KMS62980.1 hypothetical protein V475_05775 [Sphingobium baderi LL03]
MRDGTFFMTAILSESFRRHDSESWHLSFLGPTKPKGISLLSLG